jgi:hypothetical protein
MQLTATCVLSHLWEWVVVNGAHYGTSGVSMTCCGAMEALSRTLLQGRGSALGVVARIALVDSAWEPFYMHGIPEHIAMYEDGIIRWRDGMDCHDADLAVPSLTPEGAER